VTRARRVALGAALGLVVVGGAVVYPNRHKTRLRLAYPPGDVKVTRNVRYVAASTHDKHRLDVYAPVGASGPTPVVHFIHGGYWREGDKDFHATLTGLYASIGITLAKQGVLTVVQSYRLAPEVDHRGIEDDVMAALRYTEEHAAEHGGDPRCVFVMGHSAGGHLAALVATDAGLHRSRGLAPDAVRGVIALSPVWDVQSMHDAHPPSFNDDVTYAVFGRDPAVWRARSPLELVGPETRPLLVLLGEHDFSYMRAQAELARPRLEAAKVDHGFVSVPGYDHSAMVLGFGAKHDRVSRPVLDFVRARCP
jgi:acetyl esterase/lipase